MMIRMSKSSPMNSSYRRAFSCSVFSAIVFAVVVSVFWHGSFCDAFSVTSQQQARIFVLHPKSKVIPTITKAATLRQPLRRFTSLNDEIVSSVYTGNSSAQNSDVLILDERKDESELPETDISSESFSVYNIDVPALEKPEERNERPVECEGSIFTSESSSQSNQDLILTGGDDGIVHQQKEPHPVDFIAIPSVSTILSFAIPAIGVWLCSPLLSLIDTSTVGMFSGTAQQAALNPAVSVTDYSARCLSFLFTGTTNMMAVTQELDRNSGTQNHDQTAETFKGALHLSLHVGLALGVILIVFSRQMLRALIGNDSLDPEVMNAAMRYVRIRSLGMPATAMIGTAQAACLGMKDVGSPLKVVLVVGLINLVLDLALVGRPQAWVGGAAGAAWATALSQYIALALFLRRLGTSQDQTRATTKELKNGVDQDGTTKWAPISTKGVLAGHLRFRDFLRRPSAQTTDGFRPYIVPVTVTQVGRCSTYVAMAHVVSSSFGAVSMAANQIITSIFYALIPIGDSLSLTAQSFLPAIFVKQPSPERTAAIGQTIINLLKVALLFGVGLAGLVAMIPSASILFTTDPAVVTLVRRIVPVLFAIFSLHGIFCASEGVLLGQRDLSFLGRMYGAYFVVVPLLMMRIKFAAANAATATTVGLASVWNLFLGYQLFRMSAWIGRVILLQWRLKKTNLKLASKATA